MTQADAFQADMERFHAAFAELDAVTTADDGSRWIDPSKVPADMLDSYRKLIQFGYVRRHI